MDLKKKRNVTKVFAATLIFAGILTAANASAALGDGGIFTETIDLQKNHTIGGSYAVKKELTKQSSNAIIRFNRKIPAGDTVCVLIRDTKGNLASNKTHRITNVSAGTGKEIGYKPGSGNYGSYYRPYFKLDQGSQSSKLTTTYTFIA